MKKHISNWMMDLAVELPLAFVMLAIIVAAPWLMSAVRAGDASLTATGGAVAQLAVAPSPATSSLVTDPNGTSFRAEEGGLVITAGPTVNELSLTENSATITWTTNEEGASIVEFGVSPSLGQTFQAVDFSPEGGDTAYDLQHIVTLGELLPDTLYYFKVRSVTLGGLGVESGLSTFRTRATPPVQAPALKTVTIAYPAVGQEVEAAVTVKAKTDGPADSLEFRLTDGAGTTTPHPAVLDGDEWSAPLPSLVPGKYTLRAVASGPDGSGGRANVAASPVDFSVKAAEPEEDQQPQASPEEDQREQEQTKEEIEPPSEQEKSQQLQEELKKQEEQQKEAEQQTIEDEQQEEVQKEEGQKKEAEQGLKDEQEKKDKQQQEEEQKKEEEQGGSGGTGSESLTGMLTALDEFQSGLSGENDAEGAYQAAATAGVSEPERICGRSGIKPERCTAWLEAKYADKTCAAQGIAAKESCEKYLTDKNNGVFPGCEGKTAEECDAVKALTTIGYLPSVALTAVDDVIEASAERGDAVELPGLTALSTDAIGDAGWWPSAGGEPGSETSPAVVVFDADHDGLPDDVERMLGTDPNKADTDGDGVSDADELKNGTNPLGDGVMGRELSSVELAFIAGAPLEQPLGTGEVDDTFTIGVDGLKWDTPGVLTPPPPEQPTKPEVIPASPVPSGVRDGDNPYTPSEENLNKPIKVPKDLPAPLPVILSGQCAPDTTCLIYVYSYVPLVLATTTDVDGNWRYSLDGSVLAEGPHTVYIAEVDQAGQVVRKSNPLSLFIKEAQAASADDYLRSDMNVPAEPGARYQMYYLLGVVALIVLSLGVIVLFQRKQAEVAR